MNGGECPNGHGTFKEGRFCARCGSELKITDEFKNQSESAFERMFGDSPCPGCGYKLNHGHQSFCPSCGHALKWVCR